MRRWALRRWQLLTGALAAAVGLLSACGSPGPHVIGKQLDIVLRTQLSDKSGALAAGHFPHAKYTLFAFEDPTDCLQQIELLKANDDALGVAVLGHAGLLNEPQVVQRQLPDGDYRLRASFNTAPCTWMVEDVLNSMLVDATPPTAEPAPRAADLVETHLANGSSMSIAQSGLYGVRWSATPQVASGCGTVSLVSPTAGEVVLGDASGVGVGGEEGGGDGPVFLASGIKTVAAPPTCKVDVHVHPWLGPTGGGARGFAEAAEPPTTPAPTASAETSPNFGGGGCDCPIGSPIPGCDSPVQQLTFANPPGNKLPHTVLGTGPVYWGGQSVWHTAGEEGVVVIDPVVTVPVTVTFIGPTAAASTTFAGERSVTIQPVKDQWAYAEGTFAPSVAGCWTMRADYSGHAVNVKFTVVDGPLPPA